MLYANGVLYDVHQVAEAPVARPLDHLLAFVAECRCRADGLTLFVHALKSDMLPIPVDPGAWSKLLIFTGNGFMCELEKKLINKCSVVFIFFPASEST